MSKDLRQKSVSYLIVGSLQMKIFVINSLKTSNLWIGETFCIPVQESVYHKL